VSYDLSVECVVFLHELREQIRDFAVTTAWEICEEKGIDQEPDPFFIDEISDQLLSDLARYFAAHTPKVAQLAPAYTGKFYDVPEHLLPVPKGDHVYK